MAERVGKRKRKAGLSYFVDASGKTRWTITGGNGETVVTSGPFVDKKGARANARLTCAALLEDKLVRDHMPIGPLMAIRNNRR